MHDALFKQQERLGLKSWSEFASDSGVKDVTLFATCVNDISQIDRVVAGKALGKKLDIQGTPTLLINGWKLGGSPDSQELSRIMKAILVSKS